MCHTLMQTSAQRQAYLNVLPRCSLCSTKIMQTESREASWLAVFAEVQLIFDKDSIFLVKSKGFYEKNLWKVEFHCCCNSSILRFHNVCSSCCLGAKKSLV